MRPLQEIIEKGSDDELADWIEAYEPSPDNWKPVEEYFLRCAAEYVATDEAEAADYVALALSRGASLKLSGCRSPRPGTGSPARSWTR